MQMDRDTRESGETTNAMARASSPGWTIRGMRASSVTIRCMGKANSRGQLEHATKASGATTKKTVAEL